MTSKQAFGTWKSPISPALLAAGLRLQDVQFDTDGETIVWHERRPSGGMLVVKRGDDAMRDLTDTDKHVSGRVGYGGGGFTVAHGHAYFSAGGRLYKQPLTSGTAKAITPEFGGAASPVVSGDGKWVAYVHTYEEQDRLLFVDTNGNRMPLALAQGHDFIMQPQWHPDGTHLAYVAWNYPNMPWNGSELHLVTLQYGVSGAPVATANLRIAGDDDTSIFQPEFSPDGQYISYISDKTGWTHLYLYDIATGEHRQLTDGETEFGRPAWIQGMRTYGWTADSEAIYLIGRKENIAALYTYDLEHESLLRVHELDDYAAMEQIAISPKNEEIALIGAGLTTPPRVLRYSARDGVRVLRYSTNESIPTAYLSAAQPTSWEGHDGETVYGFYLPPKNSDYEASGKPPVIVQIHGGPTSFADAGLSFKHQYFTSRGFAVLVVNHRGSTGYGKDYMNKHQHSWGVYDVKDSITGVKALAQRGLVDADKAVIMGGSAGGYTVLQSLVDEPGFYKAGVSLYGVGNQFTLAMGTHKFEARYNDWLLGPLPEHTETWHDRSPLFNADKITDALLLLHGEDDNVVPVDQSEQIAKVLQRRGVPHELHTYPGEGHGFRQTETIIHAYEQILQFLLLHVVYS